MINGQLPPDAGEVRFAGRSIAGLPPRDIWRLGVGRTFQIAATFGSMTVAENVQMALIAHNGEIYRLWRPAPRIIASARIDLLHQVGMAEAADRACRELAYGDVKRVELAIALANDPRLLLMDEPTAGMAPRERNDLIALVKRLVVERGISVLFTEHSMDVVFAFADRIIVMARGRLIADGDATDDPQRSARCSRSISAPARVFERARADGERATMADAMLEVEGLNAWYGAAQILYDLSLHRRPRRSRRADGTQRRRQVDDHEGDHGADRPASRHGPLQRRGHFAASSRSRSRGWASASRRKTAASSPISPCWKISISAGSRRAVSPTAAPAPAWTPEKLFTLFPNLGEMRRPPRRAT